MADETQLISKEMSDAQGVVFRRRTSYPISASDIRKWAIACYYPELPPLQFVGAGAAGGEAPLIAPDEFNPFAWATMGQQPEPQDVDPGSLERRAGITPPNVTGMVNGGTTSEYGVPMREGDVITAEHSVKSYSQKQGKNGPLLFTELQDLWTNQRGERVRTFTITIIRF